MVNVGLLSRELHVKCEHDRCDGREARFSVGTPARDLPYRSCGVHLARFVERASNDIIRALQQCDAHEHAPAA